MFSFTESPSRMMTALPLFCLNCIAENSTTEVPLMSTTLPDALLFSIFPLSILMFEIPLIPDPIFMQAFPEQMLCERVTLVALILI